MVMRQRSTSRPTALASVASSSPKSGQVVEVDFESLLQKAHPAIRCKAQIIMDIGSCCRAIDEQKQNVGHLVQQLRDAGITLKDWSSFQAVKMLIKETWPDVQDRTLDKYTCNLGSYLEVPPDYLPAYICISAPVRYWISAGTEIDVLDTANRWWHGVALEVTRGKVKVFWVGFAKCVGGRNKLKNPELVDKKDRLFRPHEEGLDTLSGSAKNIDVAWILKEQLAQPKSFLETQIGAASSHVSDGDTGSAREAGDEEDDDEEEDDSDDDDEEEDDSDDDDDDHDYDNNGIDGTTCTRVTSIRCS